MMSCPSAPLTPNRRSVDLNVNLYVHVDDPNEIVDNISGNLRGVTGGRTPCLGSSSKKVAPVPPPKPRNYTPRRAMFQSVESTPRNQLNNRNEENEEAVEVFCRIRPLKDVTELLCVRQTKEDMIQVVPPRESKASFPSSYTFKGVFNDRTSQKQVFNQVCLPLIKDCLEGKNGLLFTYGVTGSGKTFTVTGDPRNPGILPRTLDTVFNSIQEYQATKYTFVPDGQNGFFINSPEEASKMREAKRMEEKTAVATPSRSQRQRSKEVKQLKSNMKWVTEREMDDTSIDVKHKGNRFSIFVSYIEVYNNYIYDLLDCSLTEKNSPQSKMIREDNKKRVFVVGCHEEEVCSSLEAIQVFLKGLHGRKMAETVLNAESSRSHSVFSIRVVQENSGHMIVSQLSLVDLAGSERTYRTGAQGLRLREAGNINNSLMSLRNCLDILRENQKTGSNKIVPYRDSKITHLFKSYFEGEGRVKMIICINPSADEFDETMQVLKFAEMTREVMITGMKDFVFPSTGMTLSSFGPPAPVCVFDGNDDDKVIPEWIHWLEDHKRVRDTKSLELHERQAQFREELSRTEQEILLLRNVNTVLRNDLNAREEQVKRLEAEVNVKERERDSGDRRGKTLEKHVQDLQESLEKEKKRVQELEEEKQRMQLNHEKTLRLEQLRIRSNYDDRMEKVVRELKRDHYLSKDKIKTVIQILAASEDEYKELQETVSSRAPSTPSASNVIDSPVKTRSRSQVTRRSAPTEETFTQLSVNPMMNPRHRRSASTSRTNKWLDHRPPGTLELGTVLQPKFKNRKSVTSLKDVTLDDIKRNSNYALTSHSADTETGEVETRVFKADVIPSLTGGAHVVFKDVEKLTQEDPTEQSHQEEKSKRSSRKRNTQAAPSVASSSHVNHADHAYINKRTRR